MIVSLAAMAAACSDDDGKTDGTVTTATGVTSAPTTTTGGGGTTAGARVYFVRSEKISTGGRTVKLPALARGALEALLGGPNTLEAGIGMTSAIPPDTTLRGVAIQGGKAAVDLSEQFESGGGRLSMQLRVAQIVFTLTQFDSVATVSIRIDGKDATGLGAEGVPAVDLDRGDFESVTPLILVESPTPGETVSSPVRISGIANTFEANVRYSVKGGNDQVLADGFTMASAGTGVWGEFSTTVEFDREGSDAGKVTAWQDSAETGAPIDVYEVPVRLG